MQKKEFKKFKIDFLGETLEEKIPFSVYSALSAVGLRIPDAPSDGPKAVCELRISSEMTLDEHFLSSGYLYLRLSGLTLGCRLFLNGQALGFADSRSSLSSFSVKDAAVVGTNTLEMVFSGTERDLLYAGLVERAELVRFSGALIDNVSVSERRDGGKVIIDVKTDVIGSHEGVRAVATLVSGAGQIYYGGLTRGKGSITVADPLLWWPRGVGIQNLYKLTVNLYGDMEIEDTREVRIGLVSFSTDKNPNSAAIEVNGVSLLPMGAVYREIPEPDPALRKRRTEAVVSAAAAAGFNTLVIPDGAELPNDEFYSLCDLYGISVIHEIKTLTQELSDLLSRRSYHPSVALFDVNSYGEGVDMLCDKIHALYPDAELRFLEKFPNYPSCPSTASHATLSELTGGKEWNPTSLEAEGLMPEISDTVRSLGKEYPYASGLYGIGYLSRVRASEIIANDMCSRRLAMGEDGRAVFDGISPTEEAYGVSALDGSCRYKGLMHRAKEFFSPVSLLAEISGSTVAFSLINSRRSEVSAELIFSVIDNKNNKLFTGREEITVAESEARKLFTHDLSEFISGYERERYLEYVLREGNTVIARGVKLFVPAKHFRFLEPKLRYEISGSDRRFSITLSAESFAYMTELSFPGVPVIISDNLVSLTSHAPIKISLSVTGEDTNAATLSSKLRITSMYDVAKDAGGI